MFRHFIGFLFGDPLGDALLGAIGGAVVGLLADLGIRQDFVNDVKESLMPNSSALSIIVRASDPTVALGTLQPHKGRAIQTSLPTEAEESLRHVLEERK